MTVTASPTPANSHACALELARGTTGLIPQLRSITARVSLEDQMVLARIIAAAESVADAADGGSDR